MPTPIGVLFFIVGAYFFLKKEDCLVGLLVFAGVFQAASAINIGERGIQPYYVIALFIVMRAIFNRLLVGFAPDPVPGRIWFLVFTTVAIVSAFVYPVIFAGTPVYDPKIGIDPGLFIRPPLHFGLNNLAQAGFLACHAATVYASLNIRCSKTKLLKAFYGAFYVVGLLLCAQFVAQLLHVTLPDSFLRNNPGYAIAGSDFLVNGTRNSATFTEPSAAGAFILIYAVGFIAEYVSGRESSSKVLAGLIFCGLVSSSGSLAVLAFCMLALILLHLPVRLPWYINLRQTKRLIWLMLSVIAPIVLVISFSAGYRQTLLDLTVSKGESGSFIDRTAADLFSLGLVVQTYGIGVGLGSNRASGMATTLLSNVGVVGFVAFLGFYYRLFINLESKYVWLKWSAFALLFNAFLGIADVTIPIMWIPIMVAIQLSRPSHKAMELQLEQRVLAAQ